VDQNTRPDDTRTAIVTVNNTTFRVTQNRFICSYEFDRTRLDQVASGGILSIRLTTRDWCPWTATASEPWVRLVTSSGTGSAVIGVDFQPHSGSSPRHQHLTIAGQRVEVVQQGR
jgi:hypothetical protein